MSNRMLVLGWHNIDPTPAFPAPPGSGRDGFDRQLRFLSRVANVVRFPDALARVAAGEPLPPRAVALTFDDGYADTLGAAAPILERHGMSATFFLVPGFLDRRLGAWWEDFADAVDRAGDEVLEWGGARYDLRLPGERDRAKAELPPRFKELDARTREDVVATIAARIGPGGDAPPSLFLDWAGARDLLRAGHDIGSHSDTHAILSRETEAVQAEELTTSRRQLEAGLGVTVDTLAYPNGSWADFDEVTTRCAAEAGYRGAVTVEAGLADWRTSPFELRRLVVTPHTTGRSLLGQARNHVSSLLRERSPGRRHRPDV